MLLKDFFFKNPGFLGGGKTSGILVPTHFKKNTLVSFKGIEKRRAGGTNA